LSLYSETLILMLAKLKSKFIKDVQLKELLSGSAVVLAFKILGAFSSYVFFYLLAQNWGAKGVGLFSLSVTILSVFVMLSKLGLDGLIVRQIPEYKAQGRTGEERNIYGNLMRVVLVFSMLISIGVYFLAEPLALLFLNEQLVLCFQIVAFAIIPSVVLSMNAESLRGLQHMRYFSYLQNGSVMLLSVLLLLLLSSVFDKGMATPIYIYLLSISVLAILSFFMLKTKWPKSNGRRSSIELRKTLKMSIPMLVSGTVFMIMNWTDVLMLGFFSTEDQVGIYNLCFKLASIITFAQFAINSYAAPRISSYYHSKEKLKLKALIQKIAWLNFVISIPFFVILLFFGKQILPLFGAEFTNGITVLILLAIGQLVNALSGPVLYILNMTGKEKVSRNIVVIAAFLNIVLNYILIPVYGIIGAALAATISMFVWNVTSLVYIYRNYGLLTVVYFSTK